MEFISSTQRGLTQTDWLKSYHSFSFNRFQHPRWDSFGPLRVLNDDRLAPNSGFGMHPHQNMEIITYMLSGELQHEDSTGGKGVIKTGDLQYMSAGSGIMHSEINPSESEPVHLLQIWIRPSAINLTPAYQEMQVGKVRQKNAWQQVVSSEHQPNMLRIQQDVNVYVATLMPTHELVIENKVGRGKYLYMIEGEIMSGSTHLIAGDALTFTIEESETIKAEKESQMILFDVNLK